ncbi:MAG: tripartite tricarboxylate transporter permease [Candidatus Aenigmarchaeota archaeon]|nr:tripartite tricarboxylate transporter permease [Candidatus Aenigmarchaeota archaeon]
MIENILLLVMVGCVIGIFTGMIPGMHTNTLAVLILPVYTYFGISPLGASVIISSIMAAHIFSSFIPAALLGAPDEDTALSILPAHRLLMSGRGLEAIFLMVAGASIALFFGVPLLFLSMKTFGNIYGLTRPFVHYILIAIVAMMIFGEGKKEKMFYATVIFLLSGLLGFLVLDARVLEPQNALLPVLSGLFGVSTLLTSLGKRSSMPAQKYSEATFDYRGMAKFAVVGTLAGLFVGLMPGIGASQAVVLTQQVLAVSSPESFLVMLGSVNAADSLFSMSALYTVGNPRSGASVAIERLLGEIGINELLVIVGSILLSSGIAAFVSVRLSRHVISFMKSINYSLVSYAVIIFITLMVLLFSGVTGLLVLYTAASIGILCERFGVKRTHCMGCLLLPTILFFSGNVSAFMSILRIS